MSTKNRWSLLLTLGLGIVIGYAVDRWSEVSLPTAEAQTRISLADLQAQIVALQSALQNIDATQIKAGTLASARLPPGIDASTLGGLRPSDFVRQTDAASFLTRSEGEARFVPLSGATMTGPLTCPEITSLSGVQVGFDGNPAAPFSMGTMRFNAATNTIEFSDGNLWRRLQVAP